ncbi:hypothetical protein [Bradyrhizobium japonicum]|uniref:hypothetical protein n=2 Tax=Nitrobacteraceae TaxID=41294 RepID=UPI000231D85E|nr:hypothetical protein CF64_34140 [Bradyrhizobium japonicum]BAL13487.1 hypothetical protein BJ6T_82430 [Bradyrhizobium japonicum USDA 6]GEC47302.1 hypothetical protein BJA01nite_49440 [Bradyrhizobium japonicum]
MSTNHHVTFTAAPRRFGCAQAHRRISKLRQAERQGMGSPFALVEGDTILDAGEANAVERWCRDAVVLSTGETIVTG